MATPTPHRTLNLFLDKIAELNNELLSSAAEPNP